MKVVRAPAEMSALGGGDLGFVPTMGAFHEGHLSLMRAARKSNNKVCVSLFVNPLQFSAGEDFERYPRNENRDFDMAESAGVDVMFAPSSVDIYPRESTGLHVPELTRLWEGSARPGHFDGVATIVAKLFNIVRPSDAYFGWKDLQQCLVVKRMVQDLNYSVRLNFLETVREADGLAMSSRNAYLSTTQRELAPSLRNELTRAAERIVAVDGNGPLILEESRANLIAAGFRVEYFELVSMESLLPVQNPKGAAIIVAAMLGTTRLIDNLRIGAS